MRICITLDDVIRAKTRQFAKILAKSQGKKEEDMSDVEISTNDLCEVFGMQRNEYNKFLYEDYPFEVFAEAPVMDKMLDKKLNLWTLSMQNDEQFEDGIDFIIANPFEFNTSIGYTCFFLSQIATRIREFYFPKDSSTIWDRCDVLITADPRLLSCKPEGKVSVKIEAPYNEDNEADFTYESLTKLIEDENFGKKIIDRCNA